MGVALRTIAEDGERFIFKHAEIGVFVGVDFSGHDEREMRFGLRKRRCDVIDCGGAISA
jgi:hypothetical protein